MADNDTPSPDPADQTDYDPHATSAPTVSQVEAPPHTMGGILKRLGPGLIIAGSIVGSGELIATTTTGAQAGFWLLWLILIGCVIKVFVQVEFGRYTIVTGNTAMQGMNSVPGPRLLVNWLLWWWLATFLVSIGQLGGIVGGVGQALAISVPLTERGRETNELYDTAVELKLKRAEARRLAATPLAEEQQRQAALEVADLQSRYQQLEARQQSRPPTPWTDDVIWCAMIAVITSAVLVVGRYGFIQTFSTVLVASFTLITIVNVVALQSHGEWAVSLQDIVHGMSFRLPPAEPGDPDSWKRGLGMALATFGIIGVGANELISYPYWCLEKGYARFTGPRDQTAAWAERAQGWMRVMKWDAWCSMAVYTFATIAFYLLGAAILGRSALDPEELQSEMIRTLGAMYEPVFGAAAQMLFLFGAFAVLYSTYFVASASQARVAGDALRIIRVIDGHAAWRKAIRVLSGVLPLACFFVYFFYPQPVNLVKAAGAMQAVMLPMLAAAALYFRYRHCDKRILPSRLWTIMLWLSSFGMLIAGGYLAGTKIHEWLVMFGIIGE